MSFTPTTPVTGGPQTGFTTPTYTLTVDTPPAYNAKQYAITAIGGTQAGVDTHSVSRPFTLTQFKPSTPKVLGKANPTTGVISDVPNNTYTTLTRKGVTPLAGQASRIAQAKTDLIIPAGSDTADQANLKAMLSLHFGAIWQQSGGIGDLVITGILG